MRKLNYNVPALALTAILGCTVIASASGEKGSPKQQSQSRVSVALVTKSKGTVQVRQKPTGSWQKLGLGDEVLTGQTIKVGKDGVLNLAWHRGGPRYNVPAGAEVAVKTDALLAKTAIKPTIMASRGTKATYDPKKAEGPGGRIAAATQRASSTLPTSLGTPLGGIYETRPQLQWWSVCNIFKITLYCDDKQIWMHEQKYPKASTDDQNPDLTRKLDFPSGIEVKPGKIYHWSVEAKDEEDNSKADTFTVYFWLISPKTKEYVESLRPASTADLEEQVLYLRALWDAGRYDEAVKLASACVMAQSGEPEILALSERLKNRYNDLSTGKWKEDEKNETFSVKVPWPTQ